METAITTADQCSHCYEQDRSIIVTDQSVIVEKCRRILL